MIRLHWPVVLLGTALVVLLARRPGLLFSRGFFPVLLVAGIFLLIGYRRRQRRPPDPRLGPRAGPPEPRA